MTAITPSNTRQPDLTLNFETPKVPASAATQRPVVVLCLGSSHAMARIRRNTCSADRYKFAPAFSVLIASSRVTTPLSIEKRVYSFPVTGHCVFRHTAGKPITGFPYFSLSLPPDGRFSHYGLTVQTPFPGDDEIGVSLHSPQASPHPAQFSRPTQAPPL